MHGGFHLQLAIGSVSTKNEVHGGSHLRAASIKANHDKARSYAAKSHHVTHMHSAIKYEKKKTKSKKKIKNYQR